MKKIFKIAGIVLGGFILLAIIIAAIPGGDKKLENTKNQLENKSQELQQGIEEKTGNIESKSPAFKLAALESANHTNPPQNLINEFDALLKSLNDKCSEDEELKLADYVVFSRKKLEEKNLSYSYLEVANGINNSIPVESNEDVSCAEIATAFVIMTNSR